MNYIIDQQKGVIEKFINNIQRMLQDSHEDSEFMKRADTLILDVKHQLSEIGTLTKSAESTAKNVGEKRNSLLSLDLNLYR